jgi:hypothetical protein
MDRKQAFVAPELVEYGRLEELTTAHNSVGGGCFTAGGKVSTQAEDHCDKVSKS